MPTDLPSPPRKRPTRTQLSSLEGKGDRAQTFALLIFIFVGLALLVGNSFLKLS